MYFWLLHISNEFISTGSQVAGGILTEKKNSRPEPETAPTFNVVPLNGLVFSFSFSTSLYS